MVSTDCAVHEEISTIANQVERKVDTEIEETTRIKEDSINACGMGPGGHLRLSDDISVFSLKKKCLQRGNLLGACVRGICFMSCNWGHIHGYASISRSFPMARAE